jgi:hypothetical protein
MKRLLFCVLLSSCAAQTIMGTRVPKPPLENDGFVRYACTPLSESNPDAACCVYAKEMVSWRAVCTVDGGENWALSDGGPLAHQAAPSSGESL